MIVMFHTGASHVDPAAPSPAKKVSSQLVPEPERRFYQMTWDSTLKSAYRGALTESWQRFVGAVTESAYNDSAMPDGNETKYIYYHTVTRAFQGESDEPQNEPRPHAMTDEGAYEGSLASTTPRAIEEPAEPAEELISAPHWEEMQVERFRRTRGKLQSVHI